jgi:UDP-glucose 4-epimerase
MDPKIIITGSAGHLGEALARTLREGSWRVLGMDLKPSGFTDRVGSITDRPFVSACMQGADIVIHTATLHKPHVGTHSKQEFIDTNITGTLVLLEEAIAAGASAFIFTSTTSVFGDALTPSPAQPAAWVTEDVVPAPKNIYGVTKAAAEDLCALFYRNHGLPSVVLRTSRFFPEEDDNQEMRQAYQDANAKANEFLYRRVDLEDVVSAHLLAMGKAPAIGFGRYIISATTPFSRADLSALRTNAPEVLRRIEPAYAEEYKRRGWVMFPGIDRVYDNEKARRELGWQPVYDFHHVLTSLRADKDPRSPLAQMTGSKRYHERAFENGPYPLEGI